MPPRTRGRLFVLLLGLTLGAMAVLAAADRPLRTAAAPHGIVSFELAGNVANARAMVESWDPTARLWAAFSLGFDYLFMVLYSTTIALGCLWAASRHARASALAGLGTPLAWGQWLAAVLDASENAALTRMLIAGADDPWPALAWTCAVPKFALVALGLVYVLTTAAARRGRHG